MRHLVLLLTVVCASVANAQSVFPSSAGSLEPLELGDATLLLMPDKTTVGPVHWDFREGSRQIAWVTDGYENAENRSGQVVPTRYGLMRIHVRGKKSTVMKRELTELAWTVSYSTESALKFGVEIIAIDPGEPRESCFGTLYEGCDFDPKESFENTGIAARVLCKVRTLGIEITGYELSHPNKRTTLARLITNTGSGGTSSSLELIFTTPREELCVSADANLMHAAHADLKRYLDMHHAATLACVENMLTKHNGIDTAACSNSQFLEFEVWD
jgi:hypothetical protein